MEMPLDQVRCLTARLRQRVLPMRDDAQAAFPPAIRAAPAEPPAGRQLPQPDVVSCSVGGGS